MNNKSEMDYLNYENLNIIENKIKEYTDTVSAVTDIPSFNNKIWKLNELPYVQEINRIENGITNLGYYYNKPNGWLPTKTWITYDNKYPVKAYDYKDWNRWVNNLRLFKTDIVLTDTIWNGKSFIKWEEENNVEWR